MDSGAGYNTAAFNSWATNLTTNAQAVYTTGGIVAIWSAITGRVPSNADLAGQVSTIEALTQQYGSSSIAFKGMGASLANSPFAGGFAATYNQDTNTLLGQQSFVQAAFTKALGREPTIAELNSNVAVFQIVKANYAKQPVTEVTTDARAKGEFLADLIKQAFDFSLGPNADLPIFDQAQATIVALANNTYVPNAPIEDQPGAPSGTPGQAFALTTGVDSIVGTSSDDTITGVSDGAADTFNGLDSIDGGGGKDTITLVNAGGTMTLTTAATVKNVENLVLRSGANAVTADVSSWTGLEHVNVEQIGTLADITLTTKSNATSAAIKGGDVVGITDSGAAGTDKLASVSLDGNTGAATIASDVLTTLDIANTNASATVTAAAGTRALAVTLNKVTGGTVTDAEATSLAVNTTGAAATGVTLTAAKATTITLSGDQSLTTQLGAQAANLAITSTNSAGVTISTQLNTNVSFTGGAGKDTVTLGATTKAINMGAGNDTVNLAVAALGTGGTVAGGDGVDTLGFAFADAVTASATKTLAAAVTGFEVLSLGANGTSGATIDLANLNDGGKNAITKVVYAATNTEDSTITNLQSGNTVEFTASQTNGEAATLSVKDAVTNTSDVLNVALTGAAPVKAYDVDISNVETINFLTDDTAATPTGIQHEIELVAAAAKTLTVTGDAVKITHTGTAVTTFDASGVTKGGVEWTSGNLAASATVTGGAGNDVFDLSASSKAMTINGGAGNDTITTGSGADIINGGDGDDIISAGTGLNIVTGGAGNDTFIIAVPTSGQTYTTITDASKGDKLSFVDKGTETFTATKITLADTAVFQDFLDAAAAGNGSTNGAIKWFQFSGNTYVVEDMSAASTYQNGTDLVVKLTGLVDLSTATLSGNDLTLA